MLGTEDHKPYNDGERARIEKAGGVVSMKRVDGDLAVVSVYYVHEMNEACTAVEYVGSSSSRWGVLLLEYFFSLLLFSSLLYLAGELGAYGTVVVLLFLFLEESWEACIGWAAAHSRRQSRALVPFSACMPYKYR